MAGTISIALRRRLMQAYFTADRFSGDEQLYVGVTETVGTANAPASLLSEPVVAAYQRVAIPLTSEWWEISEYGEAFNTQDLDFPAPDTGEDWGYLSGWALCDAPDGGISLAVGSLLEPTLYTSDLPPLSIEPRGVSVMLYD